MTWTHRAGRWELSGSNKEGVSSWHTPTCKFGIRPTFPRPPSFSVSRCLPPASLQTSLSLHVMSESSWEQRDRTAPHSTVSTQQSHAGILLVPSTMGDVVSSHLDEAKRGIIAGEGGCGLCGFLLPRFGTCVFTQRCGRDCTQWERNESEALSRRADLCSDAFTAFYRLKVCLSGSHYLCVGSEAAEPTLGPIRTPEPLDRSGLVKIFGSIVLFSGIFAS